ncbi:MAG: NAD-dependent epimerase/dehydratase family protein [Betaproteobacteria bacterium]
MSAPGPVVVTGADGFAGGALMSHLRHRRSATGVTLRGLVRTLSLATAARPDVLPVGDLTTITGASLANALLGARSVVHLAGRAHVMRETALEPAATFRAINVAATERLARAAAVAGATHFIFASTVKVNGESTPSAGMFTESDPPDPQDDYAASKWEAERVLADVARDTGMPVTILRLPLLYGPGAKGNIARLTDVIARGVPLPLASIHNRRSLLGAGNFSSAVDALLRGPPPAHRATATYFLADPVPVSTPQLVRAIAAALGVRPQLFALPADLLHLVGACVGKAAAIGRLTRSLEVDSRTFSAVHDWQAPHSMEEGLAMMVRSRGIPDLPAL